MVERVDITGDDVNRIRLPETCSESMRATPFFTRHMNEDHVMDGFFSAPMVVDASDGTLGNGVEVQSPGSNLWDVLQAFTQPKKGRSGHAEGYDTIHKGERHAIRFVVVRLETSA